MVVSYKIISDKRYPRRQICNFSSIFFNFLCPENIAKALMPQKNRDADPKGQPLAFIRIVSECDDRYCRGHHSHYSLQIIQTFPACCSMTTCRCRAPSRYPYQLVDTHTQPLSSSRHSRVKNIAIPLIIKRIAIVFV